MRLLLFGLLLLASCIMDTTSARYVAASCAPVAAHRGTTQGGHPEESLAAFRAGIQAGANYLDMDVRASRDGYLFLLHDTTLDRTTNLSGAIASKTRAQLLQARLTDGSRLPSLHSGLSLAARANKPVTLEVKDDVNYYLLARTIRGAGVRVVVSSFRPSILRNFSEVAPVRRTSLLQTSRTTYAQGREFGSVTIASSEITKDFVARSHRNDIVVYTYETEPGTPARWRALNAAGVDLVISDSVSAYRAEACAS